MQTTHSVKSWVNLDNLESLIRDRWELNLAAKVDI
jgi:hypothetical protein